MKYSMMILSLLILTISTAHSQGYKVGDEASGFKLKNTDGKMVSLNDFPGSKGFIVIFTCNHCPYAKAYQERIQSLDTKYKPLGYPVIAISPNDPFIVPEDSYENMVKLAGEKKFTYPYLFDETQEVYRKFGATRTPHAFLLQKEGNRLIVRYIGAIDDNYQDASQVKTPFLANAVDALLAGRTPEPSLTKSIGCSIKDKQTQN